MKDRRIAILGLGSWGTALAIVLADNGFRVNIWGRNAEQCEMINRSRENMRYLPGIILSPEIIATPDLKEALHEVRAIVYAVPSQAMREVVEATLPFLEKEHILIHVTKGLELGTYKRMSEVIRETVPVDLRQRVAVLSGPSHAEEVAIRLPTTIVSASESAEIAEQVQDLFINQNFRVYTNPDLIGVEIGGALKNIIALAAGISDGLGFGDNAKAALLTRGLAEIGRIGVKLGANPLTFAGLAGIGDLIVTGNSLHSRNYRAGKMIGEGAEVERVQENMGMVVEGIKTTKAAYELSRQLEVTMPITHELYHVLFKKKDPRLAVEDLMGRGRTHEVEEIAKYK